MKEGRLRRKADHLPAGVEIEESFDKKGKRHISLVAAEGAANLRDIASFRPEQLKTGRVFASSDLISNKQLSDIGAKTFLDLRTPQKCFTFAELRLLRSQEPKCPHEAPTRSVSGKSLKPKRWHGFYTMSSAALRPLMPKRSLPPTCHFCTAAIAQQKQKYVTVFHVALMQTSAKVSIFDHLPKQLKWQTITACCRHSNPKDTVEDNIGDDKAISYADLYKILFDHAKKQLAQALRVFSRPELFPVLIHCEHGLDRTGMVVLLLMMLCHIPVKAVVQQYVVAESRHQESDGEKLHASDVQMFADAILETIECFLNKWGTAEQYALSIGLTAKEILAIKENILADGRSAKMAVPDLDTHQPAPTDAPIVDRHT